MMSEEEPLEKSRNTNDELDSNKQIGKSVKISIKSQLEKFRRGSALQTTSNDVKKDFQFKQPSQPRGESGAGQSFGTFSRTASEDSDDLTEKRLSHDPNLIVNNSTDRSKSELQSSSTETVGEVLEDKADEDQSEDIDLGRSECETVKDNVILPIDKGVVHQICSGQVIVTLSTAVKELVENSLDAGATKIDIRLVEYGSKLIEVADNGSGIEEVNFESLALKHHTSKITEFEDLGALSTFGFRGEALSSLCALSNLTVITRDKRSEQKVGYKIEYDNNGCISSKTRTPRGEYGTTILLKDLFYTLPVRHREFAKNLKREFHRTVNILYGYCLVVNDARISCTNQVGSGQPSKVISVPSYRSMRERIVALFGSKQFASLIEIKQPEKVPEEILSEYGLNEQSFEVKYEIEGYISQPNQGRSSNDRQFFFINSRPCEPAKISRVINEVYHSFSRHQNPFVCLHVRTSRENVDVNVTPDKRTLYIQNEKILLATLKAALLPLLTEAASSFGHETSLSLSQSQLNFTGQSQSSQSLLESSACSSSDNSLQHSSSYQIDSNTNNGSSFARQYSSPGSSRLSRSVVDRTASFINRFRNLPTSSSQKRERDSDTTTSTSSIKQPKLSGFLSRDSTKTPQQHGRINQEIECVEIEPDEGVHSGENITCNSPSPHWRSSQMSTDEEDEVVVYDDEFDDCGSLDENPKRLGDVSVKVNWKEVLKSASKLLCNDGQSTTANYASRFRAKIAPSENATAEEELKKQLSKDMFSQMRIIGQFNLGFIIVKSGPDLFIVDQHASDEKYNFEDLGKTTILQGQPLIRPLDLELPAISENIIMDNVKAFQKNGFDFIISPDAEPTKRVKLSKIPYSKNTEFGKSDLEELVFMMEDASEDSFYRPTKVREMLASRACRKSVMIGTALNSKEMRAIVDHMGEMEQPWNCPHGRPTIRHLINLNLLPDLDIKFNH